MNRLDGGHILSRPGPGRASLTGRSKFYPPLPLVPCPRSGEMPEPFSERSSPAADEARPTAATVLDHERDVRGLAGRLARHDECGCLDTAERDRRARANCRWTELNGPILHRGEHDLRQAVGDAGDGRGCE